ncbi:unnamed protein product [Trifolium pratense]|uniref:Uncharacterized protein n=1 Tax=Trifolium pratense TaxID=57577 RepID=A0ACB0KQQ9_TRIPR|nr:unnamed protein product [Trifolium pratense]
MEGEINNFIMVWTIAASTMSYCHTIGKLTSQGIPRLLSLLPAIILLFLLPLRLTSIHLGGPSSFFIGWLSTFKLFLFAFNKGPLSTNPPLSLLHFISLACLPIKFQHQPNKNHPSKPNISKKDHKSKSTLSYACVTIIIILALLIPLYSKKENFHPKFVFLLYTIHMYIGLEFFFALASTFTRKILNVDLEPQFDKPYLSTSLQDFWGKRWNITVNRVLHPTVYDPVMNISSRLIGRKWAPVPGILATFVVSAMMHEVVFYYIKREKRMWEMWEPSWDAMCFFILHGVCLVIQVGVKKAFGDKLRLPKVVSWLFTVVFVWYTALWLFVPALVRCRVYEKASRELIALTEFGKDVYHMLY